MAEISFHDINCELGRRTAPRLEQRLTTEEVSLALNYAGIERALAYHAMAKEYDPREGNDALVEIVRDNRIFEPCFVILPEATGEFPYGDALIRYLADGGAAAVRLFPKSHGYGLGQTWCSTMFGALAEKGVPVLIELAESSWDEIDGVLTHNPRLNLVVVRAGYRNARWMYPMLNAHKGLYLETSVMMTYMLFEDVTERFGAERLIFGTALPDCSPAAAIAPILYCDIDDADKDLIASGGAKRLLWKGVGS